MGLPQPPSGPLPKRGGKAEPLDLSTNYNCRSKSPPFHKQRHLFSQSGPLDLSVKHDTIAPLLPSVGSDSQCTSVSNNTVNSWYNGSTLDLQQIPSVCQFEKCHRNEDVANAEYINESNSCAMVPSDRPLEEEVEKSLGGVTILQTIEALSVKTYNESSNKSHSEYLIETVNNIPQLLESDSSERPSINTNSSLINKCNGEFSSKYAHKTKKYKYESDKRKRVSESKVKSVSTMSIIAINQESTIKYCKNINNQNEYFEENIEKEGDGIENDPGTPSQNEGEEPSPKNIRLETSVPSSPNLFKKPNVKQLKKTGESFLQDGKCFEVAPKLPRCRECSLALQESIDKRQLQSDSVLCRFYAFRKLRYSSKGFLATAGFLDPHTDSTLEDLRLWKPMSDISPPDLDLQMAWFVLTHVGDQFCELCKQEEEAFSIHMSEDRTVAWKKLVPGFREMCDVCSTTLFNFHWTCRTCGFAVCIDCYKARKGCVQELPTFERPWLICANKRAHDLEKMMLTQIIAADSLKYLEEKSHEIRTSLGLPLHCCGCPPPGSNKSTNSLSDNLLNEFSAKELNLVPDIFDKQKTEREEEHSRDKITCLDPLDNASTANEASENNDTIVSFEDYCSGTEICQAKFYSSLRKRLNNSDLKNSTSITVPSNVNSAQGRVLHGDTFEEMILTIFKQDAIKDSASMVVPDIRRHVHRYSNPQNPRAYPIPTRVMTLTESHLLYPDCPHSWLCEGRLLKLSDPSHVGNYSIFQDQWKRGQPVLVSGVQEFLDGSLWQPDSFIRDFGDTKNDLVNCMTGRVIPGQYMRKFWEGFQNVSEMLKDEKGKPMFLKLKDWPPGEDFAEMLPTRFEDLMKALPLGEYTKRTGQLNLPSRLPSCFARPDLGPKMYIAYGSAVHPTKGTTNLHLDMSDAVNVMVYVGIPNDIDLEKYIREAYRAVDEACFDVLMRRRVRQISEVPGALWHIYSAKDSDKIRDLLTRVARERRIKLGPHQDPIHDQSWYLDATLRDRLYKEYDVRGYAIVQCLGDAVFIPAGAPHQVRNLLNCIKVAEDFVSPENVSHCLHLTQEFRKLSDFHTNHEDKLQIKNIIYHAVKDAVSVLSQ